MLRPAPPRYGSSSRRGGDATLPPAVALTLTLALTACSGSGEGFLCLGFSLAGGVRGRTDGCGKVYERGGVRMAWPSVTTSDGRLEYLETGGVYE